MKISTLALLALFSRAALGHEDSLTWTVLGTKLPEPLSDMTATLGPEGLVYIAGGCNSQTGNAYDVGSGYFECNSSSNAFFSYDPSTNEFRTLPALPRARYRHGAAISNNRLWLVGGRTVSTEVIMEIDVFDFATNLWITPGNHTQDTSDNAAFSDGDHVYIVGGWNTDYVARSDVWRINAATVESIEIEAVTPLQEARGDIKAATNGKGQAFVAGGFTDQNGYCPPLRTVEQYDIASMTWTYLDELKSARGDKALVEIDGHLVAIGGETQLALNCEDKHDPGEATVVIDDVEILNDEGMWQIVASIPDSRFRFDAVAVDNKIYTFGGQNGYDKECQCYATSDEILVVTDLEDEGGSDKDEGGMSGASQYDAVTVMLSAVMGMLLLN